MSSIALTGGGPNVLTTGRLLAIVAIWTAVRPGFNAPLIAAVIVGAGLGGPLRSAGFLNPSHCLQRPLIASQ